MLQRILEGKYKAGDRLIELTIAREFDTSQGPVREALKELESLRVVKTEPFRGTRVREITAEELIEVALVRGLLEATAAIRAAEALKGKTDALRKVADDLNAAAASEDFDAYARHNATFHRIIMQAGGNRVLERLWESLMLEAMTRLGLNTLKYDLNTISASHGPIVDAFHDGDGPLAARLLREHAAFMLSDPSDPNSLPLTNP